jgi:hypothetical protein
LPTLSAVGATAVVVNHVEPTSGVQHRPAGQENVPVHWVVVEQVPAAGTKVAKTEKILLRSKKKGD